jgi:hypothetical protein
VERGAEAVIRAAGTLGAAALLLALATGVLYAPLRGEDWTRVVPALPESGFARQLDAPDRRFVVWLVARNAAAWAHAPWRLFDPGTCHPAKDALRFGHPALSLGLLGVPGALASGDPVATYVSAVVLQTLLAALAMTLLVWDWTRSVAAGLIAGLLYAFLPAKTGYALYPFHGDSTWLVLSLFFARRLFAGGGPWIAAGLVASAALQFAASFYPFLASVCLGVPLVAWLALERDPHALRPRWVAVAGVGVALAALLVFAPFLGVRGSVLAGRVDPVFASPALLWPPRLTSWPCSLLALAGLLLPASRAAPALRVHPRWALLAGMALTALVATSGWGVYGALARVVPGLDTVRVPGFAMSGIHVALCVLAGMGAAGLARLCAPPRRALLLAALVCAVFVDTLRPGWLGLRPRTLYETVDVRPDANAIAFFQALSEQGNTGAVLELPLPRPGAAGLQTSSRRVLLQAYHHRRTSSCYNSFVPDEVLALGDLVARLPEPAALRALREQGFTTLVVHASLRATDLAWLRGVERAARHGAGLAPLLSRDGLRAYAIRSDASAGAGSRPQER